MILRRPHGRALTAFTITGLLVSVLNAPAFAQGTALATSIHDGDVLHGVTTVYAAGSPLPSLDLDGSPLSTAAVSSLPATLRFEGDGIQSGSQKLLNSVWVNSKLVTLINKDYQGYATAQIAIPAGYLTAGTNTVTIRAGSSISPTDLTANHDDFTVRNVRIATLDGTEIADPAVPPTRIVSLGDGYPGGHATEAQVTANFAITLDESQADGVAATVDTRPLPDGPHSLTATSAGATTTVRFLTDNTGPVITATTPADGSTITGDRVAVTVTASDSVSAVALVTAQLDGRTIPVPVSFPTGNIPAGEHTLAVTVTDAAGNPTSRNVTFRTPPPSIAPGAYYRGQIRPDAPMAGPDAPRIVAAGDIACAATSRTTPTACQQAAVADTVKSLNPDAVLTLADHQYDVGTLPAFLASYDKSWGALKDITYPIVGNHEYAQAYYPGARADGYFDYFNGVGAQDGRAGDREKGYYSYDIGRWHVVALNSECGVVSCAPGSAQYAWLQQDLQQHHNMCVMAVWHKPLYTGTFRGGSYGNADSRPLYDLADRYGVDVILNGHDHTYQRFAPQDVNGNARPDAPREFIIGTGGVGFHGAPDQVANLEAAQGNTFGALELTLKPTGYDWQFVPIAGSTSGFSDSGSASCHR
ncbi:Alkaline phosphatase [Micromonospora sp. MH33]|uniref:metallophosphoesterase n=1 Tax=Micromonospora sp. MH33 TaxID=1945509 RepID=UPI000D14B8EE|nr:metallophosphoesterase [Micromonospora sp. MH33]PSK65697.1 Alkaline phosphatase [Micromonospora sp. MH33]